ncbi:MAG: hypothetical protein OEZ13_06680 [Spirochaetia bacterium]|nr:hypothetical protein [Spirochaetia bacterium]
MSEINSVNAYTPPPMIEQPEANSRNSGDIEQNIAENASVEQADTGSSGTSSPVPDFPGSVNFTA